MTSPHTGMYGLVGFADSPRPWSMMCFNCATVSDLPTVVSAGNVGRDAAAALLAVALRAGELDEGVRPRGDRRTDGRRLGLGLSRLRLRRRRGGGGRGHRRGVRGVVPGGEADGHAGGGHRDGRSENGRQQASARPPSGPSGRRRLPVLLHGRTLTAAAARFTRKARHRRSTVLESDRAAHPPPLGHAAGDRCRRRRLGRAAAPRSAGTAGRRERGGSRRRPLPARRRPARDARPRRQAGDDPRRAARLTDPGGGRRPAAARDRRGRGRTRATRDPVRLPDDRRSGGARAETVAARGRRARRPRARPPLPRTRGRPRRRGPRPCSPRPGRAAASSRQPGARRDRPPGRRRSRRDGAARRPRRTPRRLRAGDPAGRDRPTRCSRRAARRAGSSRWRSNDRSPAGFRSSASPSSSTTRS